MKFFTNKKAMTLTELIISITISAIILMIVVKFITDITESTQGSEEKNNIVEEGFQSYGDFNKIIHSGFFGTGIINLEEGSGYDVLFVSNNDKSKGYIGGVVDVNTMKLDDPSEYDVYKNKVFGYSSLSQNQINDILNNPDKVYDVPFYKDKLYRSLFAKDFQVELYNSGSILDINFVIGMGYNKDFDGESIKSIVNNKYLMPFNLNF